MISTIGIYHCFILFALLKATFSINYSAKYQLKATNNTRTSDKRMHVISKRASTTLCPPGRFFSSHGKACGLCETGMYQDKAGQSACHKCPTGTTSSGLGAKTCRRCDYGEYQPSVGSRKCLRCEGLEVITEAAGDTLDVLLPSYYKGVYAKYKDDILNYIKVPRGLFFRSKKELFRATNCIVKDRNLIKFATPINTTGIENVQICCFNGCQTFPISHISHEQFPFLCRCSVCSEVTNKLHNITSSPGFNYSVEVKVEKRHLHSQFYTNMGGPFDTNEFMDTEFPNYCSSAETNSGSKSSTCKKLNGSLDLGITSGSSGITSEVIKPSELSTRSAGSGGRATVEVYFKFTRFIIFNVLFLRTILLHMQQ